MTLVSQSDSLLSLSSQTTDAEKASSAFSSECGLNLEDLTAIREMMAGGGSLPHTYWRSCLRTRLRETPYPLFVFANGMIPAISVWSGARLWTYAFRSAGLKAGQRIVLSLPPSPAFLQVLVAALWDGLTIALFPALTDSARLSDAIALTDATAAVALPVNCHQGAISSCDADLPGLFVPNGLEGPERIPTSLRPTRFAETPDVRFLLRTSGSSTGQGRWVALSDRNVETVLESHLPKLGLREAETRVLSILPWHHAFGLVIDLLPALLSGCEVVRDATGGRDVTALLATGLEMESNYLCAVPQTFKQLRAIPGGEAFLQSLEGGVVGGAPIDATLTSFLRSTRLRVGYGQTEAGPGIALGEPGEFPAPHYLGRSLGCDVRQDARGMLEFRGQNASVGLWNADTGFTRLPAERWHATGDLVTTGDEGTLYFAGRTDDAFKLANGRLVEAGRLETDLRTALPGIQECLLTTPDGEHLELFYTADGPNLEFSAVQAIFGRLGQRFDALHAVPESLWVRTPKGTLLRAPSLQNFRANLSIVT